MKQEAQIIVLPHKDGALYKFEYEWPEGLAIEYRETPGSVNSHHTNTPVHLYGVTDKEIKEGDYCIDGNEVFGPYEKGDILIEYKGKIVVTTDKSLTKNSNWVKADVQGHWICTNCKEWTELKENRTCKCKPIAQIPQQFIEEFCKAGGINTVLLEYERSYSNRTCKTCNLFDKSCEWGLENKCCTATGNSDRDKEYWISRTEDDNDYEIYKLKLDSNNCVITSPVEPKLYTKEQMKQAFIDGWVEYEDVQGVTFDESLGNWIEENL
tara:strand:+ start:696 stop:1496 length:801 start_codon:yes stop_codon:yes gene_type:complete